MYYAKIREMDVTNGPGVRTTLFVSGCTHACEGCFNSEAKSFTYGKEFTKDVEEQFILYTKNKLITGVNILGGEPLMQDDTLYNLLKRIKEETNKSVWLWTGYRIDEIPDDKIKVLDYVDVLVDGRFEINNRNLNLKYRGSSNQNVYFKEDGRFVLKEII